MRSLSPLHDHDKKMNRKLLAVQNRVVKPTPKTNAALWNADKLRRITLSLRKDPEADIVKLLGSDYSDSLEGHRQRAVRTAGTVSKRVFPVHDIRSRLREDEEAVTKGNLSDELVALLPKHENLSAALIDLLNDSDIVFKGPAAAAIMVFKVSTTMVVKAFNTKQAGHEFSNLEFIQAHLPGVPAPRPHGLIELQAWGFLFLTMVPGITLEDAWPRLNDAEKTGISNRLDCIFTEIRRLPRPDGMPLGTVNGSGCIDARRDVRYSHDCFMDAKQFEDWIFRGSRYASPVYTNFIRAFLAEEDEVLCVFTHSDVRPANIMVEQTDTGTWEVKGVLDWESSGFYPAYWESVKLANNLAASRSGDFDWYAYVPKCLSPTMYPVHWLVDRVWEGCMENMF